MRPDFRHLGQGERSMHAESSAQCSHSQGLGVAAFQRCSLRLTTF
jgi:hypothetical protein